MKKRYILFLLLLTSLFSCVLYGSEQKPFAVFAFTKASYQVGEDIEIIESSYSPVGNKINKKEWTIVINGKSKTSSYVKNLLKDLKAGEYELSLRVRDAKGIWSEKKRQKVTIIPAKTFKLTKFTSEKTTYAIGEKLQLTYSYENPNELNIKSQRWRYRNISNNGLMVSSKPTYLKKEGTYEISLEIQDEWGNWSNKMSCQVKVSDEKVERNGYYLFDKGRQGDLIEGYIDKDYNTFKVAPFIEVEDIPGTLIMSNSPESVKSSGILYQDTTSGQGVLTLHHQNKTNLPKKLLILVSAVDSEPVNLTISNKAIYGPSKNILKTGQKSVKQYFNRGKVKNYSLRPNETVCIYDSSETKAWNYGEVVSGILDFNSNGKVKWTIVMMDENSDRTNVSKLKILDKDVHTRGTFNVMERRYIVDVSGIQEPVKLVIGKEDSEWLEGIDALTGEKVKNKGNYGLPINIKVKNTEDVGIIINARGGGYLGALRWNQTKVFEVPNEDCLNSQKLAALVGKVNANDGAIIDYTLPNGSSAPVLFGFIPTNNWK